MHQNNIAIRIIFTKFQYFRKIKMIPFSLYAGRISAIKADRMRLPLGQKFCGSGRNFTTIRQIRQSSTIMFDTVTQRRFGMHEWHWRNAYPAHLKRFKFRQVLKFQRAGILVKIRASFRVVRREHIQFTYAPTPVK